jgi:protein gp37
MAAETSIEWTEFTWNPVTGCTKVSQGCKHCYAERMALRLKAMGSTRYANGFEPNLHWDLVDAPRRWRKPRLVFVNSMSDLFQEEIPEEFIRRVFQTMAECPQHTLEDARVLSRVADLQLVPAAVRFLSCEPLIGPLENLPLSGVDWVIVGGESGPHARRMERAWVESIRLQCEGAQVSFFFKQWGGVRKDRTGRELNGRTYDEMPRAPAAPVAVRAC